MVVKSNGLGAMKYAVRSARVNLQRLVSLFLSSVEHAPDAIPHKNEWGQEQEMTHNTQEK